MRWFQKLKQLLNLHQQNTLLRFEVEKLKQELSSANLRIGDPRAVVEKIFGRKVAWFDYNELTHENKRKYYDHAKMILESPVFSNTINYLIATQTKEQIMQYNPITKFDVARDVQMHINAWELLSEELKNIPNPDLQKPTIETDEMATKFAYQN